MERVQLGQTQSDIKLGEFKTPQPTGPIETIKREVVVEPSEESGKERPLAIPKARTIWDDMADPHLSYPGGEKAVRALERKRREEGRLKD